MTAMTGRTRGGEGKTPETQGDSQQPGPSAPHGSPLISPSAVKRSKNDTGRTVMVAFICNPCIQEAEWSQVRGQHELQSKILSEKRERREKIKRLK